MSTRQYRLHKIINDSILLALAQKILRIGLAYPFYHMRIVSSSNLNYTRRANMPNKGKRGPQVHYRKRWKKRAWLLCALKKETEQKSCLFLLP